MAQLRIIGAYGTFLLYSSQKTDGRFVGVKPSMNAVSGRWFFIIRQLQLHSKVPLEKSDWLVWYMGICSSIVDLLRRADVNTVRPLCAVVTSDRRTVWYGTYRMYGTSENDCLELPGSEHKLEQVAYVIDLEKTGKA